MPKRTLAERLERAAQKKAQAEQEQAKLMLMQRKERTRRLIEIGGLAAKAGIDGLSTAALYDRFLRIAEEAADPNAVTLWERAGGRHFHREQGDESRVVAIAKFPSKLPPDLTAQLRELGFKWNRFLVHWEGQVEWEDAKVLVEGKGGTIAKVNGAVPSPVLPGEPTPASPRPASHKRPQP
jgi:Conjugal transfer protein TraD